MKEETLCAERNISPLFDLILIRKTLGRMKIFYDICLFHASLPPHSDGAQFPCNFIFSKGKLVPRGEERKSSQSFALQLWK
jgi:hypothetical protein